ncbi:Ltp family lipoprotein [Arthrobacter dokdonensis]|uniref:Ltp family lipoprotein n=1 Tax=Arthrobacter dokdonellae TaxID=2211210 RepID=UPI001D1319B1|nr:Ltp family lipoprotein [Arthrobacter dokdonellae]
MTPQTMPYPYPLAGNQGGKSFMVTWLLALFLGGLGIDRFYLGKIGTGILKLITFGGFGIWVLIDLILVLTGVQRDKAGRPLVGYHQHKKMARIVTIAIFAIGLLISAFSPKGSAVDATPVPSATQEQAAPTTEPSIAPVVAPAATVAPKPVETVAPKPAATVAAPAPKPVAPKPAPKPAPAVPTEYYSALKSAGNYSDMMHMSKAGIYDQLTSAYGDKFSPAAAQYAVDNLKADYNQNALESAKNYQESMSMSPEAIRDQLVSDYGDKFTQAQADYAVSHLG